MRQKVQKEFSLIELLIIIAIIFIIAAIAVPNLKHSLRSKGFKESFNVEINKNQPNDEERQIVQPLVTKRLQELRDYLQKVQKEKEDLLNLPPETATPEEAMQRISKLNEIGAKITSASDALAKAENSAIFFKFKI